MARARNIKPGFYKNEELAECSVWARLLFPGLWMLADREGRLEDRPKRIKAELLPFDGEDVDRLLAELQAKGFIVRYRNSDGSFIQISKFLDHQSPHYSEKPSVIKGPELPESGGDDGGNTPVGTPENSRKTPLIKRGSQPPDSLNPDSLNPESLKETTPASGNKIPAPCGQPAAGAGPAEAGQATPPKPGTLAASAAAALETLRTTPPVGTAEHEAAGALHAVLAANACQGTAAHPAVVEMARKGVTPEQLKHAITEARKSKTGPLNPAYLAAIVERIATEPPPKQAAGWKFDDSKAESLCRDLGIPGAKRGEDRFAWHSRIAQALANPP